MRSLLRGSPVKLSAACNEACSLAVRLKLGSRTVGMKRTKIRDVGGSARFNLLLSRAGRRSSAGRAAGGYG